MPSIKKKKKERKTEKKSIFSFDHKQEVILVTISLENIFPNLSVAKGIKHTPSPSSVDTRSYRQLWTRGNLFWAVNKPIR